MIALLPASRASAVHDTGQFELDGNIAHNGTAAYDWADLFTATGAQAIAPNGTLLASTFLNDTAVPDPTYFTSNGGGVKDIAPVSQWGCTTINNPTAKDNIQNAYAAFFHIPATAGDNAGDLVLYLGSERQSNNGTSFAGFWLFKGNVACNPATGTFTGTHTDGDLLVVSDYTNGGVSQDVQLFKWTGGASGSLTAVGNGGVCGSTAGDNMCAIANSSMISSPWPPGSGAGGIASNDFVEAGIDLTQELGGAANVPCFTHFQAETRSSNQLSATLKDFAAGSFANCAPPTVNTQVKNAADNSNISSIVVGGSAYDTATLTGTVGTPQGTVTYSLFTDSKCTVASTNPVFAGPSNSATVTLTATGSVPNSPSLTFTQSGSPPPTYYWQASYSGDTSSGGRNLAATSICTSEPLTVTPAPTTVGTTPSSVLLIVGNPFSDTAVVSGGYFPAQGTSPAGTVSFKLYGPFSGTIDSASCVDGVGGNMVASYPNVAASTTNPAPTQTSATYVSPTYTPTQSGIYQWVATYNGNANSQTSTSPCGTGGEQVTVGKASPSIATTPSVTSLVVGTGSFTDTASVTGGYHPADGTAPSGQVTFKLYGPFTGTIGATSCVDSGTGANLVLGPSSVNSSSSDATSASYTSPAYTPVAAGLYQWVASYNGNSNNTAAAGVCGDTAEQITVSPASPSIATVPAAATITIGNGATIADTATVSGGYFPAAGPTPAGTVTFKLYGPFAAGTAISCVDSGASATLLTTFAKVVANSSPAPTQTTATYSSPTYVPTTTGLYQWVASYSGNGNNNQASGVCGDTAEQVTVNPAVPGIASTILLSDSVHLTPVSGAGTPTGSVAFALYGPFASSSAVSCSGTPVSGSSQTVDPLPVSGTATTPNPVAVPAGIYAWQVTYTSTSANYSGTSTSCTAEVASITYQAPSPIS